MKNQIKCAFASIFYLSFFILQGCENFKYTKNTPQINITDNNIPILVLHSNDYQEKKILYTCPYQRDEYRLYKYGLNRKLNFTYPSLDSTCNLDEIVNQDSTYLEIIKTSSDEDLIKFILNNYPDIAPKQVISMVTPRFVSLDEDTVSQSTHLVYNEYNLTKITKIFQSPQIFIHKNIFFFDAKYKDTIYYHLHKMDYCVFVCNKNIIDNIDINNNANTFYYIEKNILDASKNIQSIFKNNHTLLKFVVNKNEQGFWDVKKTILNPNSIYFRQTGD